MSETEKCETESIKKSLLDLMMVNDEMGLICTEAERNEAFKRLADFLLEKGY